MRRPGPRLIVVRAVDALKVYVPFMLLQGGFAERLPEYAQLPWVIFVWLYSLSRVPVIFLDWATIGYDIDGEGVTHRAGWPSRTVTRVRWSEVAALSVDQDAVHRFLQRHRVTFSMGAESRPAIVLEAIPEAEVEQWRNWFDRKHATDAPEQVMDRQEETTATEQVSRVDLVNLLVISVTYGQWVLVLPFLVSTYYEAAQWFQLPGEVSILRWLAQSPGWTLLGAFLVATVYGWMRAWLRYGGYRVNRIGEYYEITHRALGRSARRVRAADVVGVRIDQNPVMRLLGMGALHLVLPGSQGMEQRLTVLPVAPIAVVEQHMQVFLPGPRPNPGRLHHGLALAVGIPLAAGSVALFLTEQPWPAGLVGLLALWAVNRLSTAVRTGEGNRVVFTRGMWTRRRYQLGAGALRSLSYWRPGGLVSATLLDQSVVTLLASGVPESERSRLRANIRSHSVMSRHS